MLLIQASRDALLKPLQIVSGIVERRHTLPILSNILLRKDGSKVSFLSTDIEIQIQTAADLGVGDETAATTVAARKLLDILRSLQETEVQLSLEGKRLTVRGGKSRFALQTLGPEEFPTVQMADEYPVVLNVAQKTLKHLLQSVHFAMALADIRYYLNGLLLVVEGNQLKAIATDGHRLAYCCAELDGQDLPRQEAIVPRKTILELQRLMADNDEPVKVELASNQARFTFADIELVSKLIEGKFPDYNRVIPVNHTKKVVVDRNVALAALQRAAILTSDKFKGVRMTLSPSTLKISATNSEQEEASDELDVDYTGDALDIGFNVAYLLDVFNTIKTEQIQIAFNDANSSALITLPDDDHFKYVVMPMRI